MVLIKPTLSGKTLESLQGQFSGSHILLDSVKLFIENFCLISSGTISHVFCPRYAILSIPWCTLFASGVIKFLWFCKFFWLVVLSMNISQVISGPSFCFILKISIANASLGYFYGVCRLNWFLLKDFHKIIFLWL